MGNNVTMTRANKTVLVNVWNKDNKQLEKVKANFTGKLDEPTKRTIRQDFERMSCTVCKFYEDTIKTDKERKYALDAETFYFNAERVDKRPNGDYISRTAKASKISVTLYNNYTDTIEYDTIIVDGTNEDKIKRAARKRYKGTDKQVLDYEVVEIIEALYIMTVDKFIELATVIE